MDAAATYFLPNRIIIMLLLVQHAVLHQHGGGRWAGFFKGMAAYSALNAVQLVAVHSAGEGGAARASGSSGGGRPRAAFFFVTDSSSAGMAQNNRSGSVKAKHQHILSGCRPPFSSLLPPQ
jgi:hypothetical protein